MTSSAIVAAEEYSAIVFFESLAMAPPPTPKMTSIVGKIQDKINVNFHCLVNAIINAETNVEAALSVTDT